MGVSKRASAPACAATMRAYFDLRDDNEVKLARPRLTLLSSRYQAGREERAGAGLSRDSLA